MPMTYAGGFSISMCCRLLIFLPDSRIRGALETSTNVALISAALVGMNLTIMWTVHGRLDTAGSLFLILTFFYGLAVLNPPSKQPSKDSKVKIGSFVKYGACLAAFLYGYIGPVVGLQSMASSTMYGNVMQYGKGNHYVVPTFLLQKHYYNHSPAKLQQLGADAPLPEVLEAHMANSFGGGVLRVDHTTSPVMRQLAPAHARAQLPERAKDLLKMVGAGGHYFELYARRNYFERPLFNLSTSALHVDEKGDHVPRSEQTDAELLKYVQPAYEMRRVLGLARAKGESFELTYTKIPQSVDSIREWRTFQGSQVLLTETSAGEAKCIERAQSGEEKPCAEDEIALLPPPPRWLQKILLPYPIPLIPTDTVDDLYCST
eukprot:TRINITY_DN16554_c0_g1_i2.p1 TRINITY_DN16554_c0_g1~~TRINITY_DN16554_c0_g1_i2.p1  ORF type:complete len:375 (+),score=72.93 TRINITY_DN16554_c0_g1_i2:901-2025(+)